MRKLARQKRSLVLAVLLSSSVGVSALAIAPSLVRERGTTHDAGQKGTLEGATDRQPARSEQVCNGEEDHTREIVLSISPSLDEGVAKNIQERRSPGQDRKRNCSARVLSGKELEVTISYDGDDPGDSGIVMRFAPSASASTPSVAAQVRFRTDSGERGEWKNVNGWARVNSTSWVPGALFIADFSLHGIQCGYWQCRDDTVVTRIE
jgi:hypothetical protein